MICFSGDSADFLSDVEDDEDLEMKSTRVSTFFKWQKPIVRISRQSVEEEEDVMESAKKVKIMTDQCDG